MQLNVDTVPQDGRYTFVFNEKKIGVRVSSIPTPYGESFVCRLLISDVCRRKSPTKRSNALQQQTWMRENGTHG